MRPPSTRRATSSRKGRPRAPRGGGGGPPRTRLSDPEARRRMKAMMADLRPAEWDNFWKWSGPEGIVVADIPSGRHPEWLGRTLAEVARARAQDPFEAA